MKLPSDTGSCSATPSPVVSDGCEAEKTKKRRRRKEKRIPWAALKGEAKRQELMNVNKEGTQD